MTFQHDREHFEDILDAAQSVAFEFLESLSTRPPGYVLQSLPHDVLPDEGVGAIDALRLFRDKYEAQISGSALMHWSDALRALIERPRHVQATAMYSLV